jgi:adenylate cyclase class IV
VQVQLERPIKNFCPDFAPIRRILQTLHAVSVEEKDQIDYFFALPADGDGTSTRRLKLRIENGQPRCIYYYDRKPSNEQRVNFHIFEVHEPIIKDILATVLGMQKIVQKRREVWRKDHVIFNLDHVHQVGQIFEVEIESGAGNDSTQQAEYYRRLFAPYLGVAVVGSNEDMVAELASSVHIDKRC